MSIRLVFFVCFRFQLLIRAWTKTDHNIYGRKVEEKLISARLKYNHEAIS